MSQIELPTAEEVSALPEDGGPDFNRLVFETSPYLLQHARNPVDWRPWGSEAFEAARERDCPVFLSIGYSTCHWCHVMERESFERDDVAQVLNGLFVPMKVDREERPDLDEIYMAATQLVTGRGGWPMSVWLTPDGEPFFAGTYYPREDRVVGMEPGQKPIVQPGFISLLGQLSAFWKGHRQEALERARDLSESVRRHCHQTGGAAPEGGASVVDTAVEELTAAFDSFHGGFGGAPKFPPHGSLRLLLHLLEHGDERGRPMLERTLAAMAQGGVHDHVGGGFHRYSTDERWLVPHFEKMLYDNAQLGRAYVDGWRLLGDERHRLVAERLYDWVLREMVDEAGGLTSALDADSEGEEGTFYVWEPDEVGRILGDDAAAAFCAAYDVQPDGNWRDESSGQVMETSIPHLHEALDHEAWSAQVGALEALYVERVKRIWPHHDDKVLTSWNGLMIGSLAHAGVHLERQDYIEAASRAATFAHGTLWRDGRLLATYRAGDARLSAYLDDHVFLADGLLDLHEATGDDSWFAFARDLMEVVLARFSHEEGGFYFTADDHEQLLVRSRSGIDRAIPSGNGVAARVLHRLGEATGDDRYSEAARRTVAAFGGLMARYTRATESLVLASALIGAQPQAEPGDGLSAREGNLRVSWAGGPIQVPAGGRAAFSLEVEIDPGFHIQAHRPTADHLIATRLRVAGAEGLTLEDVTYPQAHLEEIGDMSLAVLSGSFSLSGSLAAAAEATPGTVVAELVLRHQACDDRACQRPANLALAIQVEILPG